MTVPIPPVMPVDGVLQHAAQSPQGLHDLAAEFGRMMEHDPRASDYNRPDHNDHATVASEFLARQDRAMHQPVEDMHRFGVEAPHLSLPEMTARHIELVYEMSTVQMQFNSCAYVAHSAKSSLQTLMKNQ